MSSRTAPTPKSRTKAKKPAAKKAASKAPRRSGDIAPRTSANPRGTKAKSPTKQRQNGGRRVSTGRGLESGASTRVRLSSEQRAVLDELSKREGVSAAAYLRNRLSESARIARSDVEASPAAPSSPWPATFVEFAAEVLEIKFTRAQRVVALVAFDSVDPCDLEDPRERELARELFGNIERVPLEARSQLLVLRLGRSSGKSLLTASWLFYRLLTADLEAVGPGDQAAVCVISPRRDTSQIIAGYVRHFASLPKIEPLVVSSSMAGVVLRRPDDKREVQFRIAPKSAGGSSLRGLSLIAVAVDESEFLPSAGPQAVVKDSDIVDAAMPRGLPGFLCILSSTPWPAPSVTAALFDENFGHPVTALAALGTTLTMRDNDARLAAKVESEMRRSPENAQREYFCTIAEAAMGGQFLAPGDIKRAVVIGEIAARRENARAGIDPAFRSDSFALAIVEDQDGRMILVHYESVSPTPQMPLLPSEVVPRLARVAAEHGCETWYTDKYRTGLVRIHASSVGVETEVIEPEDAMVALREAFRDGKIGIPNDPVLISGLRAVMFRPRTGGGLTITQPRSRETGHGDVISALANAVAAPANVTWDFAVFPINGRNDI